MWMNIHYIGQKFDFWRSCDIEDWSNDAGNSALITEINCIKNIHIENSYFKL